ncbi:helix-turn-helix domain-containing protein [Halosegnis longus]|uniref:HTH iclR-type domain-containing protein n=1 Tax=Halosegnis longus TaxID=2216012 RepID=A0AAJ4R6J9_9EURY|nr:hypothetical protein Nmn1133_13960 [Salella cibi]
MTDEDTYSFSEETEIEEGEITAKEMDWLRSIGVMRPNVRSGNKVKEATLNINVLAQVAFEYDLLQSVARRVEIDVLRFFRVSEENTHTTSEISESTGRPKSSVSRALSRLV